MKLDIRKQEKQFANTIMNIIRKNIHLLPDECTKIKPSTTDEDTKMSFDLHFELDIHVSVRLRKAKYLEYNDITIRSKSKKGRKTELGKLKEGMGQLYFYAYLNEDETEITHWILIDINKLRPYLTSYEGNDAHIGKKDNYDGTGFYSYGFKFLHKIDAIIVYGNIKKKQPKYCQLEIE